MQRLYGARDAMEAHFLRQVLEDHGIPAQVLGESLSLGRGELPLTSETLPSIWVRQEDFQRARELVREFTTRAPPAEPQLEPWTCPGCGERIEGQFVACWNCQTERPQALG